mgnify:CR=1 FL=1
MAEEIFYSDIIFDFNKNEITKDVGLVTNANSIKDSIVNLLLTNMGERLYDSRKGSNVPSMLFNIADLKTTVLLRKFVYNTIENFEPRVTLQNVLIDTNDNEFLITVKFTIISEKNVLQSLTLPLPIN